jgi:UrcA family protein
MAFMQPLESFGRSSRALHAAAAGGIASWPHVASDPGRRRRQTPPHTWETTMTTNLASTKTLRRHVLTTVAVALLGATFAAPASSAPPAITVKYGDLDLTRTAGRETLRARLDHAATALCGEVSNADIRGKQSTARCHASAIDGAIASMNNPAFAAWYAGRTGAAEGTQQVASR